MEISTDEAKEQPPELASGATEGEEVMLALVSLATAIPAHCCKRRMPGRRSDGR